MLLCFFIGMYLLHTNVVRLDVEMIYRNKMALELNNMYGKHRPLMCNKNVKKLLKYCVVK